MASGESEAMIRTRGLSKVFFTGFWRRRVEALRGIDLEVHQNEILGFLGPNGAGKTTTIKILLGIIYPSGGEARVLGAAAGDVKIKERVGFLPEQPYFYDYLRGGEFLDFYARFHGLGKRERKRRVDDLISRVGLCSAADLPLRKYSKGMLQRIGLAQALIGNPELVILDEPMTGLDPLGRRDIREIIFGLKEEGKTVFFSSHILPDVEQICDRVCIIHQGRVIDTGRLDEVLKPTVEMIDLQFRDLGEEGAASLLSLSSKYPGLRAIKKGGLLLVSAPGWEAAEEAEQAGRAHGGRLVSLQQQRETLEAHFIREIHDEEEA